MSVSIEIQVNGSVTIVPENATLTDLLKEINPLQQRIAVEVNQLIIPRSRYQEVLLKSGDVIEVITAVGGG